MGTARLDLLSLLRLLFLAGATAFAACTSSLSLQLLEARLSDLPCAPSVRNYTLPQWVCR